MAGCKISPKVDLSARDTNMQVKSRVPIVLTVNYSPDGKYLLTGDAKNKAHLWDLASITKHTTLMGHTSPVYGSAFHPDRSTVVSSDFAVFSKSTLRFWEIATGRQVREISDFHTRPNIDKLSISPDGCLIIGQNSPVSLVDVPGTVEVYDARKGELVKKFPGEYGIFSPDGRSILVSGKDLELIDYTTGGVKWKSDAASETHFKGHIAAFSPDGKYILNVRHTLSGFSTVKISHHLIDAATGRLIREFGQSSASGFMASEYHWVGSLAFSPDGQYVLSGDHNATYRLWDLSTGQLAHEFRVPDELSGTLFVGAPSASFSPDGKTIAAITLGGTHFFDVATGARIASLVAFEDGEWLITTPSGYYSSSEKGDQYLDVAVKGQPYSIAQLRESFYRPDLVKLALAGGSLKGFRKVEDLQLPPSVAIVDTPSVISSQEATVTLRITNKGGGIGDIRLYLNGSAVVLDNKRGIAIVQGKDPDSILRKYPIKLSSGVNTLRAVAFNGDNSMQSLDAVQEITSTCHMVAKPSLHALVIGINDYRNPKLQLKYAVADAVLFADTLRDCAAPLFEKVEIKRLLTPSETTRSSIVQELRAMHALNPDDLFVFYVASHGTVDDGEYFLITSDIGSTSTAKLKADALSQDLLKELIANIPATKKLVVIDTCNAGKLGDAIQTAMLTRGMSEDTATKVLSRAVGSTVLAASTSLQEAVEGYQGHGLFTYVITEGLKGKADSDRDGFVKTTELANYVDDEVPQLAEKVFKRAQYPTISPSGMGFPISKPR